MQPSGGQASELIRPLWVLSGVAIKQICFSRFVLLLYVLPCDLSLMSFCPMIPSVSWPSPEAMYAFGVWPLELWPQQTSLLYIMPCLGHFITAPQNGLRQRLCRFFTWSVDSSFLNWGLALSLAWDNEVETVLWNVILYLDMVLLYFYHCHAESMSWWAAGPLGAKHKLSSYCLVHGSKNNEMAGKMNQLVKHWL